MPVYKPSPRSHSRLSPGTEKPLQPKSRFRRSKSVKLSFSCLPFLPSSSPSSLPAPVPAPTRLQVAFNLIIPYAKEIARAKTQVKNHEERSIRTHLFHRSTGSPASVEWVKKNTSAGHDGKLALRPGCPRPESYQLIHFHCRDAQVAFGAGSWRRIRLLRIQHDREVRISPILLNGYT